MKTLAIILLVSIMSSCVYDKDENQVVDKQASRSLNKYESSEVSFPHPADFAEQLKHGKLYLKNKKSCTQCHDDGGDVSNNYPQKSGPNCSSCHNEYPHEGQAKKDWVGNHGKFFKKSFPSGDPSASSCIKCHGGDLLEKSANLKKVSCSTCHAPMPHNTNDWAYGLGSGNHHSDFIKQNGVSDCRKCHGSDINQADVTKHNQGKAQFCSNCHVPKVEEEPEVKVPEVPEHVPFPHVMEDWVWGQKQTGKHHSDYLKVRGVRDCKGCHDANISDEDVSAGRQGKAQFCSKCHSN